MAIASLGFDKMAKITLKWPKITKKKAKNGPKWSEMFRKMLQMRPVIPKPNCPTENGEKLPKYGKNYPKKAQSSRKWQIFFVSFRDRYYFLKTYLQTKFQLIWPSNNRENWKKIKSVFLGKTRVPFLFSWLFEGQMSWNLVSI